VAGVPPKSRALHQPPIPVRIAVLPIVSPLGNDTTPIAPMTGDPFDPPLRHRIRGHLALSTRCQPIRGDFPVSRSSCSISGSTGLTRWWSKPASLERLRSFSWPQPGDFLKTTSRTESSVDNSPRDVCNRGPIYLIAPSLVHTTYPGVRSLFFFPGFLVQKCRIAQTVGLRGHFHHSEGLRAPGSSALRSPLSLKGMWTCTQLPPSA